MKVKKGVWVLCGMLLLSGCQKAPVKVKVGMESYKTNKGLSNAKLRYVGLEELRKEKLQSISVYGDNLILPEMSNLDKISRVYQIEGVLDYSLYNRKQIIKEKFNLPKNIKWSKQKNGLGKFDEVEDGYYVGVSDYGMFSYVKDLSRDNMSTENANIQYLKRNENSVNKGELDNVYRQLKPFRDLYPQELKFDPEYFWVDRQNDVTHINGSFSYKGIDIFDTEINDERISGQFCSSMSIAIDNKNNGVFSLILQPVFTVKKTTPINKLISLRCAVDIVSEKLSGFKSLTIDEIKPVYLTQLVNENKKGSFHGEKVKCRPMYDFKIRTNDKDADELNGYFNILVDMQTGEEIDDIGRNGLKPRE